MVTSDHEAGNAALFLVTEAATNRKPAAARLPTNNQDAARETHGDDTKTSRY
jgi:hypothetical protein